eukprot:8168666-Pyramimonas_sp.AAC.2
MHPGLVAGWSLVLARTPPSPRYDSHRLRCSAIKGVTAPDASHLLFSPDATYPDPAQLVRGVRPPHNDPLIGVTIYKHCQCAEDRLSAGGPSRKAGGRTPHHIGWARLSFRHNTGASLCVCLVDIALWSNL